MYAGVLSHFSHIRLCDPMDPRVLSWDSSGKNTGVDCPPPWALPNPGIEPKSLMSTCIVKQVLYHQCYLGSLRYMCSVLVAQSFLLCDPMDCSLPGSSVHGVFQAKILEWVVIPFFRGFSQPRDRTQVSCIAGESFTD